MIFRSGSNGSAKASARLRPRYRSIRPEQLLRSAEMVGNRMGENPQRFRGELVFGKHGINNSPCTACAAWGADGKSLVVSEWTEFVGMTGVSRVFGEACKAGWLRGRTARAIRGSTGCVAQGGDGKSLLISWRIEFPIGRTTFLFPERVILRCQQI